MIKTMKFIDFNTWMTIIAMTRNTVDILNQYVKIGQDDVLPEFPRDLAKFRKPSIIIQKVATDISDVGFGGYLGQHYDQQENQYTDVSGKYHDLTFQYDLFANNNNEIAMLESAIVDEVLCNSEITIYDHVTNLKNPDVVGIAKLSSDIDITPLDAASNYDYRTAIRFYLNVIQTIVPKQDTINLTKWLKINQSVKI